MTSLRPTSPPLAWLFACAVALALTLAPTRARAASFEIPAQGSHALKLGLPAPVGDASGVAGAVYATVKRDLDLAGYFTLVTTGPAQDGGVEPGTFSFDGWKASKTAALAKTRVLANGAGGCDAGPGRVCVDVYVYDVYGGAKISGKRVKGTPDDARAIGHEIASAILMAIVGDPGFFQGHLAAVAIRGGSNKELYVVGVDGADVRPVTRNGSINLSPSWSKDGRLLAWTSWKRGNPDVFVKDLTTGHVRLLSSRTGVELSPAFSPDGRTIAMARSLGGETDLWLVDAQTGADIRKLTSGGGIDVSPSFTPDGRTIVFSSERGGAPSIYAVSVQGGEPTRVTPFGGRFTDPVVSPDGRRVAFVVQQGAFDVWVCNLDGTGLVKITSGSGDNEDPTWSPDGRYLAFSSTRGGRQNIWLATSDGRHQVALTEGGGWSMPSWRPTP
jgi:TolB protein